MYYNISPFDDTLIGSIRAGRKSRFGVLFPLGGGILCGNSQFIGNVVLLFYQPPHNEKLCSVIVVSVLLAPSNPAGP